VPSITFLVILTREQTEPEDLNPHLRIDLNGTVLAEGPFNLNFRGHLRTRGFAEIGGLVITAPGVLTFSLLQGEQPIASWRIFVNYIGQPQISQSVPDERAVDATSTALTPGTQVRRRQRRRSN
jgi:hypothetical protein